MLIDTTAWARVTGQPGVAIVTAGPGLTDAVTGVATAWRANIPIVVIGGQAPRAFQDMGGLQDMGPIAREDNEPVFHAWWEGRVYAMMRVLRTQRGLWNLDASRSGIESLPPVPW